MHYIYAIKSCVKQWIYVGMTNDVERRLKEHNSGKNRSTKPYLPFELVYTEQLESREAARLREKYLKSGSGKRWLKSRINQ
jgi:putative endonuclease